MADSTLVETQQDTGDGDAVIAQMEAELNPESQIPDKFKGKSTEEVIQSYQELESQLGKQGQELGELRKTFDSYIKSELDNRQRREAQRQPDNSYDHELSNEQLESEVRQDVQSELSGELTTLKKERFELELGKAHSDYVDVIQDENFQKWVVESPIRTELFQRADLQYDHRVASELFDMWKQRQGTEAIAAQAATAEADKAFDTAQMEVGTPNNPVSDKKYRRADIVNLMQTNPERYRQLEPEIRKAYAEGRVI